MKKHLYYQHASSCMTVKEFQSIEVQFKNKNQHLHQEFIKNRYANDNIPEKINHTKPRKMEMETTQPNHNQILTTKNYQEK